MNSWAQVGTLYVLEVFSQNVIRVRDNGLELTHNCSQLHLMMLGGD